MKRRPGRAGAAHAPAAGLFVVTTCVLLAFAAWGGDEQASFAADRAGQLPTSKPLATVGWSVRRLDPLTLAPTGRRVALPEYRRAYSFAPTGKRIAFGISSGRGPAIGHGGRRGIRLINRRHLTVSTNIRTGMYIDALAWLRPRRLLAATGGTVRTVDPSTGEVLNSHNLKFSSRFRCPAADAREQALILLASSGNRNLFVIGLDGVRTFELPPEFARCGRIALAPSHKRIFVVAEGGDPIVELELESSELTVHSAPGGSVGRVDAIGLPDRRVLLARRDQNGLPLGVEVVDLETGSTTTIDPEAGEARLVKGTVLTYNGRRVQGAARKGVRGYRLDGERRFRLLGGKRIAKVEAAGRFAYAMRRRGVAVIDVPSGTVVKRSSTRPPLNAKLLTRRPAHGYTPR